MFSNSVNSSGIEAMDNFNSLAGKLWIPEDLKMTIPSICSGAERIIRMLILFTVFDGDLVLF